MWKCSYLSKRNPKNKQIKMSIFFSSHLYFLRAGNCVKFIYLLGFLAQPNGMRRTINCLRRLTNKDELHQWMKIEALKGRSQVEGAFFVPLRMIYARHLFASLFSEE